MGLDHSDHIFGTILDVYAAAGSTRTNDFIDNSRPCDHNRKLCGSSHITPKFVTYVMPADTPRHVKPYIVVFAFWISEYMAIAVESVEMGGGG